MKMERNEKTLEEKLIEICEYEMAQEIMNMFANHFRINRIEIDVGNVNLKSDNTTEGTTISIEDKILSDILEIKWKLKGGETGQLFLTFV